MKVSRIFLALGISFWLFPSPSQSEETPPNFLFILADDLGWADTTLYGHTDLYETPHLERLAARGMTFTRAYTANPLCSPTRSSILTGLHPARTGLTAPNCHTPKVILQATVAETAAPDKPLTRYESVTRLDTKYETLAERLKAEGYFTGHFGKWHLGAEPYSPFEHGFDVDIPHWHGPGPAGSFVAPWKFPDFKEKYPGEHIEDRMGDEAVAFLKERVANDEPFFLNYWQFSVHAPFDAKADLIAKYREKVDPEDAQRSPTYAAMVQSLDDNVGKMLDALDRLEIADDTVIVFYSDNGGNMYNEVDGTTPTSNRPLRGGKGNNWDGGVRVPAVIVWPGVTEPGSRCDELITSTDFFPTFLEILGKSPSPDQQFDGISLVPALKGGALERDAIFTWFPHSTGVPDTLPPSAAVYQNDWKLFRFFHQGENGQDQHALYHLDDDIGERTDLSAENPERVATMVSLLDQFIADTGAVFPGYNPDYDAESATLRHAGWSAAQGAQLTKKDSHLNVQCVEDNSKVNLAVREPVEGGQLTLRVRMNSHDHPSAIHLRWAEKGVKPLYFRDRLVVTKPIPAGEWTTLDIPFAAKKPVTSFRIDFMRPPGRVEIESVELLRGEKIERTWRFDE